MTNINDLFTPTAQSAFGRAFVACHKNDDLDDWFLAIGRRGSNEDADYQVIFREMFGERYGDVREELPGTFEIEIHSLESRAGHSEIFTFHSDK